MRLAAELKWPRLIVLRHIYNTMSVCDCECTLMMSRGGFEAKETFTTVLVF